MQLTAPLTPLCLTALCLKVANAFTPLNDTLFQSIVPSDQVFLLKDSKYLALTSEPVFNFPYVNDPSQGPLTYISALSATTTGDQVQQAFNESLAKDDVFNDGFLKDVVLSADGPDNVDASVITYLEGLGASILYAGTDGPSTCGNSTLVPCPLFATTDGEKIYLSRVHRMYADTYQTFVTGIYRSNDAYKTFPQFESSGGSALIPVPSRLYSTDDNRPLAGQRIGVKDIYDLEGIQTTAGSRAYTQVNAVASTTGPALQQIIDLGGVIVGKQKTAQFASPASAWDWNDFYYPRSPRGETFLSCSASSSGAGCSIAAYDWLDFAIGTDTGLSIRQPAAFSGTYGNRPSQGMIRMDNIVTNAFNADTAGVFARDPAKWAAFAKAWYDPSLHQDTSVNGLPALSVVDDNTFPKRILYPVDHLPLQNPAAETILQKFLSEASSAVGASVENFNLTQTIEDTTGRTLLEVLGDLSILWTHDLIKETAQPLVASYSSGFPPIDQPFRQVFHTVTIDDSVYTAAMANRTRDAELWHDKVLFSTTDSCSEAIFVYDVGTGGLPTFREQDLNDSPGATLPADPRGPRAVSTTASYFGDVDYTIPIGQVSYFSNVTFQQEIMPVTVNLVAKRGCDFVLFNLVNKLADQGILQTVLTGKQAFAS